MGSEVPPASSGLYYMYSLIYGKPCITGSKNVALNQWDKNIPVLWPAFLGTH